MVLRPRRCLPSLLRRSSTVAHLLQLHALLLKSALDHDPHFAAELVASSCALSLPHARSLFVHLPSPAPVSSWNSLIRAYAGSGSPLKAIALFSSLRRAGALPDQFTFPFVLKACCRSYALGSGVATHGLVLKTGFASDLYVGNKLLHMYGCCGTVDLAQKVFDEMGVRDVVSWSSLIDGYATSNNPVLAFMVFREMRHSNAMPNSVTLVGLLSATSQLCDLNKGRCIHSHISVNNVELDVALGTALVRMYAKCGHIEEAFQVFKSMEEKNLQTWTIMISGFADHGQAKEAIALFPQMEASCKPDSTSFSSILSACSHLGMVDEGRKFFNRMVNEYKIRPTIEHYGCMVDLLGRAGLLDSAFQFIKNMPMVPNNVILRSFLGACKKHGCFCGPDQKLDLLINRLLKEEPNLGANYVLAADVSVVTSRWSDVAKLRNKMGERGLEKVPGCSWLPVHRRNDESFALICS